MKILDRYLMRQVFLAMLLVFVFMTFLISILRFLEELNYGLAGDYQTNEALLYILFTTPETTYEYMPFIIMIGCLFALGNLSNNSELTVLRAAGMSITKIIRPVFISVAVLLIFIISINELFTPIWSHNADVLKQSSASKGGSSKYGEWKKEEGAFIYLGVIDDQSIEDIKSFKFKSNQLIETKEIDEMSFDSQNKTWFANSPSSSWLFDKNRWVSSLNENNLNFEFTPELLEANQVRVNLLAMNKLWQLMQYNKAQQLNNDSFAVSFYTKLFMPIITLALVWISSIFVFGSNRKTAIGTRIFIGVLVGIILKLLQNLLTPMVINFSLSPLFIGLVPLLVIFIMGLMLYRRMR